MRLSSLLPWRRRDPYWDAYVNRPPADPSNLVPPHVRNAPEGAVYPIKSDVHTPEVMSQHIQDLGRFFGAALIGVAPLGLNESNDYPFAVVAAIPAEYDPRTSPGIGGQAAALTGAYVAFNLAAAIREYGFRAARSGSLDLDRIAVCAGLGTLDPAGRLVAREYGSRLYLADVIRTDLPLKPGTEETYEWARPTS
jgi:hypothetical protein